MSATLSAKKFSDYFSSAPVLSIPGRAFPVDLLHSSEAQPDYLDSAIVATIQVHTDWQESFPGDILVFLTGSEEIETARKALEDKVRPHLGRGLSDCHGDLYSVRESALRTTDGSLRKDEGEHKEGHPIDQHRRDLPYHSRHSLRHRYWSDEAAFCSMPEPEVRY